MYLINWSYKVVRYRCSFPRSSQNQRDLPMDIPLVRIEVLRYDKKEKKLEKGKMQTKTELTLEQTHQGVSNEVLVIPMVAAAGSRQVKIHSHMLILDRHTDEVLKLKNFKKDDYSSFQDQEKYEHVGLKVTSTQDGKRSQDDDKRLCLVDDLKEAQVHMQVKLKGTSSSLKSKDHYAYHKLKDKDSRPRAKTKDIRRM
ncbi:hypothetical protein Tco_1198070 [Tanacetum coccineum]